VHPAPRPLLAELPTCGLRPDPGADPDTGPLYASLDRDDADHESCRRLIEATNEMPLVPAPVLVEVDYWMHTRLRPEDYARVRQLCDQYADSDVGFVDAAVLAIVERLDEPKPATLDHRHLGLLRPRHVSALTLLTE
jgi:uncharacterized protein